MGNNQNLTKKIKYLIYFHDAVNKVKILKKFVGGRKNENKIKEEKK